MHAGNTDRVAGPVADAAIGAVPGGLPKPPAHPPAEPIIIKVPPRPREEPEVDRPDDGEEDDGIRRAPWMPDMPPPLPPEERPHQMLGADRSFPSLSVGHRQRVPSLARTPGFRFRQACELSAEDSQNAGDRPAARQLVLPVQRRAAVAGKTHQRASAARGAVHGPAQRSLEQAAGLQRPRRRTWSARCRRPARVYPQFADKSEDVPGDVLGDGKRKLLASHALGAVTSTAQAGGLTVARWALP